MPSTSPPIPARSMAEPTSTPGEVRAAFRAEAERLSEVAAGQDGAGLGRPSPCPPWTVGELLYHVRVAVGHLSAMLAEPPPGTRHGGDAQTDGGRPDAGALVSAAGYYRGDHRFSASTNAD